MNFNKIFSLITSMFVIFGFLAGCAPKQNQPNNVTNDTTPTVAANTNAANKGVQVGIVLPTKDEPRWIQDELRFKEGLENKGFTTEILFSEGSPAKEKENVELLITKGIKVLIICPQDGDAAAAAADAAAAAGVKVISYDRLITNTDSVDYYVTFDSLEVGAAQAQYLVNNATGLSLPLYLYAGAASDNNAFLFFEGAWKVLQPKIADGTFIVKNSAAAVSFKDKADLNREEIGEIIGQITTEWKFDVAKNKAESNLTQANLVDKGNVFILAPNDGTARTIADTFLSDSDIEKIFITGQDAEKASVQYILDGTQNMTVFKDVRNLVLDSIDMAVAIISGGVPKTTGFYDNNAKEVPSIQTAVVTVDKDNVFEILIDSGYYDAAEFKLSN